MYAVPKCNISYPIPSIYVPSPTNMYHEFTNAQLQTYQTIPLVTHPYAFVYMPTEGGTSVSALETESNLFYELLELFQSVRLFDMYKFKYPLQVAHCTHSRDSCLAFDWKRKECVHSFALDSPKDIVFMDLSHYENVFPCQKQGGCWILRLEETKSTFITELLFAVSSRYDQVHIIQPTVSVNTKFLVCQKFGPPQSPCHTIPLLFTHFTNELNVTLDKVELERKNKLIHQCLHHEHKNEKRNIQKCIKWCERHDVPFQKQKSNVFKDEL